MTKITGIAKIDFTVVLELNEAEIKALDALVGYGDDAFLKVFYENLGQAYLKPHEKGLRSLFKSVKEQLSYHIHRIDVTRKA